MELKIPVSVVLFPPRPPFNIVLSIRHRAERPVFRFRYWLGTKEAVRNGSSDSNHAHRPMTARASGFASPPYAVVFSTFFRATGARACVGTGHHFFSSQRRRLCCSPPAAPVRYAAYPNPAPEPKHETPSCGGRGGK